MVTYIEQCKKLSLTARVSIALKVFDTYCQENNLNHSMVAEFNNYLWKWPLIDGPDQFEPWESSRPFLVNFGIGDESNNELDNILTQANISEYTFREIVGGIVEILWGSFWGACEDDLSLDSLDKVIQHACVKTLPNLTPFKFSKFSENEGWGIKLTSDDVTYWRKCVNYV